MNVPEARVISIGRMAAAIIDLATWSGLVDATANNIRRGGHDFAVDVYLDDVRRWRSVQVRRVGYRRSRIVAQCRRCDAVLIVPVRHRLLWPTFRSVAADYMRALDGQGCSCVARAA